MANIAPIRGLRYTAKAGSMSDLVTPPYDVIDEAAQERYYRRHPYNMIRLEYGKTYPEDNPENNRYTRAAADFLAWQKEEILAREPAPALYRYEQKFTHEGVWKTRRGLICGVKLEPYEKGVVLPHEETLPNHKADRLALMRACRANFSPIFGLFADPEKIVEQCLTNGGSQPPDLSFVDENGQQHNLWVITDQNAIARVQQAMAGKRIYIADGHHRYETALNYRNERRAREKAADEKEHLYDYVLMTLVNLYDPGLVILPTHRLIRNVPDLVLEKLLAGIEENFSVEKFPLAAGRENLRAFRKVLRERGEAAGCRAPGEPPGQIRHPHVFGFYGGGGALYLLTLKEPSALARAAGDHHSPVWHNLDVAVLHTLILDRLLGIGKEQLAGGGYVTYTREEERALAAVDNGEYQLAFFLNPTMVEEVIAVAAAGEKMPQKSTYFYPKLITGLVINPLE